MYIAGKILFTWNTCSIQAKFSFKILRILHSTILLKNTSVDGWGHSMTSKGEHEFFCFMQARVFYLASTITSDHKIGRLSLS
jgi:hypothetical protein